jgi:hypothetical protein
VFCILRKSIRSEFNPGFCFSQNQCASRDGGSGAREVGKHRGTEGTEKGASPGWDGLNEPVPLWSPCLCVLWFVVRAGIGNTESQRAQRREQCRGGLDWMSLYLCGLCDSVFHGLPVCVEFENTEAQWARRGTIASLSPCSHASNVVRALHRSFLEGQSR